MVCTTLPGVALGVDLPDLLHAEAVLLRLAALLQVEARDRLLESEPRTPSPRNTYLPISSMPGS
jgi:hypothetical protein